MYVIGVNGIEFLLEFELEFESWNLNCPLSTIEN